MNKTKIIRMSAMIFVFVYLGGVGSINGAPLMQEAIDKVTNEVIQSIPVQLPIKRVGVFPLTNDINNQVTNSLISALTQQGRFTILERERLEEVRREEKLILSGVITPETAVKIGQKAGAEALFIGHITKQQQILGIANLNVSLKLIAVESGEILWAKDNLDAAAKNAFGKIQWYIVLLLIFAIVMIYIIAKGSRGEKKSKLDTAESHRSRLIIPLGKTEGMLNQCQDICMKHMKSAGEESLKQDWGAVADLCKEVRNDVNLLKKEVEQAEFGQIDEILYRDSKKLAKFDEKIKKHFEKISDRVEDFQQVVTKENNPKKLSGTKIKMTVQKARQNFSIRDGILA